MDKATARVHGDLAELEAGGASFGRCASQDGPDTCSDFARREWFDHIVIGAELEAGDSVFLVAERGEQDDRHVAGRAGMAEHFEAVTFGQHQVEEHQVGVGLVELGDCLVAVSGFDDGEAVVFEVLGQHFADHGFIVDDEDGLGDRGHHPTLNPVSPA